MIGVAIVGCGVVGTKRARALAAHPGSRLVAVADSDRPRADQLARQYPGCAAADDWRTVIGRGDVTLVIVCTTNDALVPVALGAAEHGKHLLVEKPAARGSSELMPLLEVTARERICAKVGFNLRFHPALQKAHALFSEGAVGPLMYIRARYGHGGRLGYEREWRADPRRAGGGELLDQGVHLIDLARWFAGDFVDVQAHVGTFFWPMAVEDNGFLSLRTAGGQVAWLHASCTEWKNLFSFEVFGRHGKLQVDGLGGSYGLERLSFYRMRPGMGPPETTIWEYPGEDGSWAEEYRFFVDCIRSGRVSSGTLADALAALDVVRRAYDGAAASMTSFASAHLGGAS